MVTKILMFFLCNTKIIKKELFVSLKRDNTDHLCVVAGGCCHLIKNDGISCKEALHQKPSHDCFICDQMHLFATSFMLMTPSTHQLFMG